ncbi:MAG: AraC family transcriptional regulator [Pseudanabaena sp.]|nr:MAG: AraC family transcriptional regulator [Pseudanabaena sp.]
MKPIPLVRANVVFPFVQFLNQIGAPTERLLRQVKLPVTTLENPEVLIPAYLANDFLEQAAHREGIENLGVIVGQQTFAETFGVYGKLVSQSLTLYDLLKTIEGLHAKFNSGARYDFKIVGDTVWLHHILDLSRSIVCKQSRCFALMAMLNVIRLATGSNWQPTAIYLQCNKFQDLDWCNNFANTRIHFNKAINAIAFPKSLLSMPLSNSLLANDTKSLLEAKQLLDITAPAQDFSGSLRQLVRSLLSQGDFNITLMAESSGMSLRTFQRRLASEGMAFNRLVEQIRFEEATRLLREPAIKVVEIGYELGYKDASNFRRAFRRWTGTSPRSFQKAHTKD